MYLISMIFYSIKFLNKIYNMNNLNYQNKPQKRVIRLINCGLALFIHVFLFVFDDDILVFTNAIDSSCNTIFDTLHTFCETLVGH